MNLRGSAFATRQNYIRGVRELMLHYQRLPEQCKASEVTAFLILQKEQKGYSSSTVNMRVCGLKYYFREVAHRLDLVVDIPNPRVKKYDTEILTIQEVQLLMNCCRDMRQVLIISLLYDTGIRVRELIRLRVSDFDKHTSSIIIRNSKGNKTRVIYYGKGLREVLRKYCQARGGVPQNTLVENYNEIGRPLTMRGVQYIVKQIVKRSRIKKRICPHTLRHTYAVHFLNAGGSILQLQQLLGHKYLSSTFHYLQYVQIPKEQRVSVLDELHRLCNL